MSSTQITAWKVGPATVASACARSFRRSADQRLVRRSGRGVLVATAQNRGGFSLVELVVSGILLGIVMFVAVPTLDWAGKQHRETERRRQAMIEVANIMDRLTASGWEQITDETGRKIVLAEHLRRHFPGAQLHIDVLPDPKRGDTKRVSVRLSWKDSTGQLVTPVRLNAWVYRDGRTR